MHEQQAHSETEAQRSHLEWVNCLLDSTCSMYASLYHSMVSLEGLQGSCPMRLQRMGACHLQTAVASDGRVSCPCSTMFLMGPLRQLSKMFEKGRIVATLVYLVFMVLTLLCAIKVPPSPASWHCGMCVQP